MWQAAAFLSVLKFVISILMEITHTTLSFQTVVIVLFIYTLKPKASTGKENTRQLPCTDPVSIVPSQWVETHPWATIISVPNLQIPSVVVPASLTTH